MVGWITGVGLWALDWVAGMRWGGCELGRGGLGGCSEDADKAVLGRL